MAWNPILQWIALAVLSFFLRPKPPKAPPPASLGELSVPTAKEGQEIGVLFGSREIKGANVAWYGDLRTRAIRKKGGKK